MVSVYSDEISFKFFRYVSANFGLPMGGGTQSYQDVGVLQYMWDIGREWEDLESREHHDLHTVKQLQVLI